MTTNKHPGWVRQPIQTHMAAGEQTLLALRRHSATQGLKLVQSEDSPIEVMRNRWAPPSGGKWEGGGGILIQSVRRKSALSSFYCQLNVPPGFWADTT